MPSKAANITTAAACPSVPVAPTVMGYNRTYVTVRWEPPEVDGGSPVTSYQVELQPKSKAALEGMPPEWVTVSRVSSIPSRFPTRLGQSWIWRLITPHQI